MVIPWKDWKKCWPYIFLSSKFSFNIQLKFDKSDIWDGQFLDIYGSILHKKYIIEEYLQATSGP